MSSSYNGWTAERLIEFETDIAKIFEAGRIKAPVHLSGGNEWQLLDIFAEHDIGNKQTWCFATHRSHYHALLKGIPPEWLKAEILANRSITINNAEFKFFSSAIVGGILPIAIGVAMTGQTAWVFCGDMASETGIFHECAKFALGHELPVHFVVEDNGYSVETPTAAVWRFSYERKFPHQGTSKGFIIF